MPPIDTFNLRNLIPLNTLSEAQFEKLCIDNPVEELPKGSILFKQGETRIEFVYVLSGTVSLQTHDSELETVSGGSAAARFALAHQFPRRATAIAEETVCILRIASAYVNPETSVASKHDPIEESAEDWMAALLKSPIFQRMSPSSLHSFLSNLEELKLKAGQQIFKQDDAGDYYYVIKNGVCTLSRKPSRLAKEIKLAELKMGDAFGEDSLISDRPRNLTVTMKTDGVLLRLKKSDFLELVKQPNINLLNIEQAARLKSPVWLDVRPAKAFEENHLPEAINIPFFELRMDLNRLDKKKTYLLICEDGKTSESAAFLLIRHGFEAFVLEGGMGESPCFEAETYQEEDIDIKVQSLQEQISHLNAEVDEREATIRSLRAEIKNSRAQSVSEASMLQSKLKSADQEIAQLKAAQETEQNETSNLIHIQKPVLWGLAAILALLAAALFKCIA